PAAGVVAASSVTAASATPEIAAIRRTCAAHRWRTEAARSAAEWERDSGAAMAQLRGARWHRPQRILKGDTLDSSLRLLVRPPTRARHHVARSAADVLAVDDSHLRIVRESGARRGELRQNRA